MKQKANQVELILGTLVTQAPGLLANVTSTEPIGGNNVPADIPLNSSNGAANQAAADYFRNRFDDPGTAVIGGADLENLGIITPAHEWFCCLRINDQSLCKQKPYHAWLRLKSFFAPDARFGPNPAMNLPRRFKAVKNGRTMLSRFGPRG